MDVHAIRPNRYFVHTNTPRQMTTLFLIHTSYMYIYSYYTVFREITYHDDNKQDVVCNMITSSFRSFSMSLNYE